MKLESHRKKKNIRKGNKKGNFKHGMKMDKLKVKGVTLMDMKMVYG